MVFSVTFEPLTERAGPGRLGVDLLPFSLAGSDLMLSPTTLGFGSLLLLLLLGERGTVDTVDLWTPLESGGGRTIGAPLDSSLGDAS